MFYLERIKGLENEIYLLKKQIKMLVCEHPIEMVSITDFSAYGTYSNCSDIIGKKHCTVCGKIFKQYTNKIDLMKDTNVLLREKINFNAFKLKEKSLDK